MARQPVAAVEAGARAHRVGTAGAASNGVGVDGESVAWVHIEPSRGWVPIKLAELWQYRELLYFLSWRDVKARYKQTALGVAWAIVQPFCTMVVFSLFFGRLAGVPSDGIPYPVFAYAALVPWNFFANGLDKASTSLVVGSNLITKVYFPRLAMPVAAVVSGVVDFVLAFVVLVGMMLFYDLVPSIKIVVLPLFLLLALVTALGTALWLSALYVQYRDIRHVVPFLIQLWLFSTPVAYPSSLLSSPTWRFVYGLNPMVGVIDGFRWALLGTTAAPGLMLVASSVVAVAVLIGGALYFRRMEKNFADVV
jgi:lipopolysaccharide transport system permease protein